MAERTRPRRGHAAASARIVSAGFSSAAALGMVAGIAVSATAGEKATLPEAPVVRRDAAAASPAASATTPPELVVVIRRHWVQVPSLPPTPAARTPTPTPPLVTPPGRTIPTTAQAPATPTPAPQPAPRPAPRPVTRTRGS